MTHEDINAPPFKRAMKRYKRRKGETTDFSDVVDFFRIEDRNDITELALHRPTSDDALALSAEARAFTIDGYEGFVFIRDALDTRAQLTLASRSLHRWVEPEWTSNTSLHTLLDESEHGSLCDFMGTHNGERLARLRWATLGYHYDWSARAYRAGWCSPFPDDLSAIARDCAAAVGTSIIPEAAIVNIYHESSNMGGHQDDLELTFDAPVVSLSVGNSAVFLLGGLDKEEEKPPLACWIRSGDVVIMGGPSRLRYHGVPRIIADSCPDFVLLDGDHHPDEDELALGQAAMLRMHEVLGSDVRLNINVRQVLALGQSFPSSAEEQKELEKESSLSPKHSNTMEK
jgi:alkylated DNA repair protein alkB family protein 1